jgi:hypothetical protein
VAVPAILGSFAFVGLRHTLTGVDAPKLTTDEGGLCADGETRNEEHAPSPSR